MMRVRQEESWVFDVDIMSATAGISVVVTPESVLSSDRKTSKTGSLAGFGRGTAVETRRRKNWNIRNMNINIDGIMCPVWKSQTSRKISPIDPMNLGVNILQDWKMKKSFRYWNSLPRKGRFSLCNLPFILRKILIILTCEVRLMISWPWVTVYSV